jgi:uncharacterized oxidoreductase
MFLEAGNKVIICGRREERLLDAQKAHPGINTMQCDLARNEERQRLVEWISSEFKSLNILVNNAGIQRDIDFTEGIEAYFAGENEIAINLESPVILTTLLIPLLRENDNAAIIYVSSGLGFIPAVMTPVYSITKSGIHAFTMVLRQQLLETGVKVFEVIPPAVDTELNRAGRAKRGNYKPDLKPGEFVKGIMKALENDVPEIGYGHTAELITASREELDKRFRDMNSRW